MKFEYPQRIYLAESYGTEGTLDWYQEVDKEKEHMEYLRADLTPKWNTNLEEALDTKLNSIVAYSKCYGEFLVHNVDYDADEDVYIFYSKDYDDPYTDVIAWYQLPTFKPSEHE